MLQAHDSAIGSIQLASGQIALHPPHRFGALRPTVPLAWQQAAKRRLDIVLATLGLLAFALPLLLAAVAIKLESPGPVLFRQRRIGWNNRSFEMWKLRTMHPHAEGALLCQARPHDQRFTRVGAWLRRTSLDEVPQFVQVLRGDMSLVGPRPHAPGTCAGGVPFERLSERYALRHRVLPGMTGLAQVRGLRGQTDTPDKLLHRLDSDLEYIATWSLWLDLRILARTVVSVLCMRNAC